MYGEGMQVLGTEQWRDIWERSSGGMFVNRAVAECL